MKKLLAAVLLFALVLNIIVLWPSGKQPEGGQPCAAAKISLPENGTSPLSVLMKF